MSTSNLDFRILALTMAPINVGANLRGNYTQTKDINANLDIYVWVLPTFIYALPCAIKTTRKFRLGFLSPVLKHKQI